ncbi:hypothetical protein OROMI_034699 [Orobanche minor]
MHALFYREVVRPGRDDEFGYPVGQRDIRFSRFEYAIVTRLRFGDSEFDVRTVVAPPAGGVYQRYLELRRRIALDRVRDIFVDGHFRAQDGDALKVAKPCGYHVYGNMYAFAIWAYEVIPSLCALCDTKPTDPEIQRPRVTWWQLKKLSPIDFTLLIDEEAIFNSRLINSFSIFRVNIGLSWEVGPMWFEKFGDRNVLLEEESACSDIYRWFSDDLARVPKDELSFLVQYFHGLRPFWGAHQPWWELDEVWSICNIGPDRANPHWIVVRMVLKSGSLWCTTV